MNNLIQLHRWLGAIACVAVLMFASSGLLHPVMSRLQPRPAVSAAPPLQLPAPAMSLRAVLQQHALDEFAAASLVQLPAAAAYRVQLAQGSVRYFNALTGSEIADGEAIHARALARHFLGDSSAPIAGSEKLTAFDKDYVYVNRLLPAWRIRFQRDDGMSVYVDTAGNRLATLTDANKRVLQGYFRALHDFNFLDGQPLLRVGVMLVLLTATFATTLLGLLMFVRLPRAAQRFVRQPTRRWHRRIALAVSLSTCAFTVSGSLHLLQSQREPVLRAAPSAAFRSDELGDFAFPHAFDLVRADGEPCYRTAAAIGGMAANAHEHHHHAAPATAVQGDTAQCFDSHAGQRIEDADRIVAETLARHYAGGSASDGIATEATAALASMVPVTRFDGEYGFANKRLPVWKVQFAGDDRRWYVETASGALALRVDGVDAFVSTVFSLLHKARFVVDPYRNLRDGLLVAFALANIVVALLGLRLLLLNWRRSRRAYSRRA